MATIGFGLTLVFIKVSTLRASPIVSNVVFTGVAAIVQLSVFLFYKLKGTPLPVTAAGLLFSGFGGLCLGIYTVTLFLTFSQIPISKASPVIYSGAILLASGFGMLLLGEGVSWQKLVGITLLIVSLFLVFSQ